MQEIPNEDLSEEPENSQSGNIKDEIISPAEAGTINPTQETENMEVHHHPDIHHKTKKWKEYFLEFLMIFLAVTMGFIAENIREHFSETKIAHQTLEAYRNDLLQHQEYFKETIVQFNNLLPVYDSLVSIFYEKKENEELPVVSRLIYKGTRNFVVTINTPTYEQLISSGSLRFIENKELKASMASYQADINSYINYNNGILILVNSQIVEMGKIIDFHDFWNRKKMDISRNYSPDMNPFTLSKEQRNSIIQYNKIYSVQFQGGLSEITILTKSNEALVKLLDKELDR